MTEYKDKIKSCINTSLLTFIGMWTIVINLINPFFDEEFYTAASMLCVLFLISAIFGSLMTLAKKNWVVLLAGMGIIGLFVWNKFDEIAGGCAYCVNLVIDNYSDYFGVKMLYLDYTKRMLRDFDPAMFCYTSVILLALINSFAISRRKLAFIPILLALASLFAPIVIEVYPSVFAMLLTVCYCIMLLIIINAKSQKGQGSAMIETTAIIFGIALMLVGGIVTLVKPEEDFEQNEFFPEFRNEARMFITENIEDFRFFEGNNSPVSSIGGGALGHVESLTFSEEEVLKVTLPAIKDTVYIKGYIGANYTSKQWEEPDNNYTRLFKSLRKVEYSPSVMVSEYLDALGNAQTLTGMKGSMKIEQLSELTLFEFAPLYPDLPYAYTPEFDDTVKDIPEGTYIDYYSVPDEVFQVSDEYIREVLGDEFYANNLLYSDYVYDNYMEVNTPIADELITQWGRYPVDTADERYNVAYAIRNYLQNTCTYTTSPGKVPDDEDFVEYFLKETKEGYCTYFATAAVMMFRSAGIPARYVEGYSFNVTGREDITEYKSTYVFNGVGGERLTGYCEINVLDSDAHAWVEFYIDGIGWVDFEVTPGNSAIGSAQEKSDGNMNPEQFGKDEEPTTEEPATEEPTTEEPATEEPTSEGETTKEPTSEGETTKPATEDETTTENTSDSGIQENPAGPSGGEFKKTDPKVIRGILIVLGIILGCFAIAFLIVLRHKKVVYARELYSSSENELDRLAIFEYMIFIRLMRHIKLDKPDYMTNLEYAEHIAKSCECVEYDEAIEISKMQEKAEFAKDLLTMEEIVKCRQIIDAIRDRIYEQKNYFQKFIFKYILNL